MAKLDPIAEHPLGEAPYDKIKYVRMDCRRVPHYVVEGSTKAPCGASAALGLAFSIHGGSCFYCSKRFAPQPLARAKAHRDHVLAKRRGGSDRLHNYVIACTDCGSEKADQPIWAFRGRAAEVYYRALERHIARALGGAV